MAVIQHKRITLATMCIATFVAILDTTVVNLALHSIQADLHADVTLLQWILELYNLMYAGFIMTGGILGDLYGRRRVFVIGMALFTGGSVLCALAPGAGWLIAGRGIAGLGAALQLPGSLAILNVTFDDRERGRAISIWGGCNGLAMAVGPTIGGVLVEHLGWRSVFMLVVPFGAAAIGLALRYVSESSNAPGLRLDVRGQLLSIIILVGLTFGIIQGPVLTWSSPWVIGALVASALGAIGFIAVERRQDVPVVSLDVFRDRGFSAAIVDAALMTFGFYGMLFTVPLYMQSVRGHGAMVAGLVLVPMSVVFFLLSLGGGYLYERLGARIPVATGFVLVACGLFRLAFVEADSSYATLVVALVVVGVGCAVATGPLFTTAVAHAPRSRSGMSSGLLNVGRMVGAALGVAVLGAIFTAHVGSNVQQGTFEVPNFIAGMRGALLVGACGELAGAIIAIALLPGAAPDRRSGPAHAAHPA